MIPFFDLEKRKKILFGYYVLFSQTLFFTSFFLLTLLYLQPFFLASQYKSKQFLGSPQSLFMLLFFSAQKKKSFFLLTGALARADDDVELTSAPRQSPSPTENTTRSFSSLGMEPWQNRRTLWKISSARVLSVCVSACLARACAILRAPGAQKIKFADCLGLGNAHKEY